MTRLLHSLIRETLLLEEVYGAQAVVYHGTTADPVALISALLRDEFKAGVGAGEMYGKGLYTVYDLKGTKTEEGGYGDHVIKLKVNLYGYIIFDPDIARLVYKKSLTPAQQAEEVGYSETVVKALEGVRPPRKGAFTSDSALRVSKELQHNVKGLVFTGRRDGKVVIVYDPTTAVPMAWKRVAQDGSPVSEPWTSVDKASLLEPRERPDVSAREGRPVQQSALRRSAMGDFEAGKWTPLKLLKYLERLPKDQRIFNGDLDLHDTPITSLPAYLSIHGDLYLTHSHITSLPEGLEVNGNVELGHSHITSLPADLSVHGNLNLSHSHIISLPDNLKVGGNLNLIRTPIISLPDNLQVIGSLNISNTRITSLPDNLQVGGTLFLSDTPIVSLPLSLKVGDFIYGLDHKYRSSVPWNLRIKLV